jgi:hypothetical protein
MHPVARESVKYWKNLRAQQSVFSARFYFVCIEFAVLMPIYILTNHDFYLRHTYSTDPLNIE